MSLTKAIQHNQSLFIAAAISILCFGTITACHLTQKQKEAIVTTALPIAEAAATAAPPPWKDIALGIISLLGSGVVVDNRRKDVLIKRLKTENANANAIISVIPTPPNNNRTVIPPICDN
jgi:hypothetical protein